MELNLRSFLFGIGFAQSIFLILVLWRVRNTTNQGAIEVLHWLILSFSWFLLDEFSEASRLDHFLPKFSTSSFTIDLALGPLVYLLVRKTIRQEAQIFQKDLLHLLPFFVSTIAYLSFHFAVPFEQSLFRNPNLTSTATILVNVKFAHLFFYHIWAFLLLRQTAPPLTEKLIVLKKLVFAVLCLLIVNVPAFNFDSFGLEPWIDADFIANTFLTIILFAMAFIFIQHPAFLREAVSVVNLPKYRTSPLDEDKKNTYHQRLLALMEQEKAYRDSELRLEDVAAKLEVSPYYLSQILSEKQGQNFYEFINVYRVKEAQELIESPRNDHKTLLALGLEAGFNSKTSFNRAFKKYAGMTPSEYKEQIVI